MSSILVIDDNIHICHALESLFKLEGYKVLSAYSPEESWSLLSKNSVDLILQDMNFTSGQMLGEQGKDLFYALRQRYPETPIVLMTAWTQLEMVVELIKAGATDYISKPWDDHRLLLTVANALKLKQLSEEVKRAEAERSLVFNDKDLCGLILASHEMRQVVHMALQLAPSNAAVLITGPNGAGKEGIANILHANSERREKPFIKLNMGALPAELIEAELFGAEAGAFSGATQTRIGRFEAADGGSLFLDEIGNLTPAGQAKLLRVLQTGEFERLGSSKTRKVNVRVISATNADLTQAINDGSFRQDLYYRINVVQLSVPALCQRRDDILPLVKIFLKGEKYLSPKAEEALLNYDWPGNVRELQNICHRVLLLCKSDEVSVEDLALPTSNLPPRRSLDDIERDSIEQALLKSGGVISRAAKSLGISRQALYRRMGYYNIEGP